MNSKLSAAPLPRALFRLVAVVSAKQRDQSDVSNNKQWNKQWKAFVERESLGLAAGARPETIDESNRFVGPASEAARGKLEFRLIWPAEGPWRAKS